MSESARAGWRVVHLRRPPVIRLDGVPHVPRVDLREVQQRWARMRAANPAFFDGRLLHVRSVSRNGHGGATLHVAECAYRHWAVGLAGFDTGTRALGVKGIVVADGCVLVGRRDGRVAAYPDCWEFAPGGGLEPGCEPRAMLERELREETGIACGAGDRVSARALLLDASVRSWEIVHEVLLARRPDTSASSREYSRIRWLPLEALADSGSGGGPGPDSGRELLESACGGPVTDCAAAMVALLPASRPAVRR